MSDRMEIARAGWGDNVPEWIVALVRACDAPRASQNKVATRLGVSAAVVSQTLRNSYAGNMGTIEDRVRAVYLDGDADCPALGRVPAESCLRWRDRASHLTSASPIVVRMFRACAICTRNASQGNEEDTA